MSPPLLLATASGGAGDGLSDGAATVFITPPTPGAALALLGILIIFTFDCNGGFEQPRPDGVNFR